MSLSALLKLAMKKKKKLFKTEIRAYRQLVLQKAFIKSLCKGIGRIQASGRSAETAMVLDLNEENCPLVAEKASGKRRISEIQNFIGLEEEFAPPPQLKKGKI